MGLQGCGSCDFQQTDIGENPGRIRITFRVILPFCKGQVLIRQIDVGGTRCPGTFDKVLEIVYVFGITAIFSNLLLKSGWENVAEATKGATISKAAHRFFILVNG